LLETHQGEATDSSTPRPFLKKSPFRAGHKIAISSQPQAESGSCVVLSGHLAAMMGPPGRPGGVEVGYPPRTPAQARVCTAPGDVPALCPRGPRGFRSNAAGSDRGSSGGPARAASDAYEGENHASYAKSYRLSTSNSRVGGGRLPGRGRLSGSASHDCGHY
jgi:hypothetical protein